MVSVLANRMWRACCAPHAKTLFMTFKIQINMVVKVREVRKFKATNSKALNICMIGSLVVTISID